MFLIITFYYLFKAMRCLIKKKQEIRSWSAIDDKSFINEMKKRGEMDETYILKIRKLLSKSLWIPYDKIYPSLKFDALDECFEQFTPTSKIAEIIGYLQEDLYHQKKLSFEDARRLKIETVSDFIYFSAILDDELQSEKENQK